MATLYNLSSFLQEIKENIGIGDIALPVTDEALQRRIVNSALKEFSLRAPFLRTILLTEKDLIDDPSISKEISYHNHVYRIPRIEYEGTSILWVNNFKPRQYTYFTGGFGPVDAAIAGVSDIRLAATIASTFGKAVTYNFQKPDRLIVYNGYQNGTYECELALKHPSNLATIPEDTWSSFLRLAELDIEEYLYGLMKRKTEMDVGIGSINLKIDEWSDARQQKRDLLNEWDEDNVSGFHIVRF